MKTKMLWIFLSFFSAFYFVCFSTKITCDFNIISFSNVMERKIQFFFNNFLLGARNMLACFLVYVAWDIFHFLHCILCQHIEVVCVHISLSHTSHGLDNLHNKFFLSILAAARFISCCFLLYFDVIFMAFPVSF